MAGQVCIDSSGTLLFLLPYDLTPSATALWRAWVKEETEIVAPPLLFAEITSALRESVNFGRIEDAEGERALSIFVRLGVRSVYPGDLRRRAWALAKAHSRPQAHDAEYPAIAATLGCDLWTADPRLTEAVQAPWVKRVG